MLAAIGGKEEEEMKEAVTEPTQLRRGTRNRTQRNWVSEKGALRLTQPEKKLLRMQKVSVMPTAPVQDDEDRLSQLAPIDNTVIETPSQKDDLELGSPNPNEG